MTQKMSFLERGRKKGREEALRRQALRTLNMKAEEGRETLTPFTLGNLLH